MKYNNDIIMKWMMKNVIMKMKIMKEERRK